MIIQIKLNWTKFNVDSSYRVERQTDGHHKTNGCFRTLFSARSKYVKEVGCEDGN
jgi:hypothetical protein